MAELTVNRLSIQAFFSRMQGMKFLIPDYQRPYKWDIEKCETLWNDIQEFHQNKAQEEYFLGTVVSVRENNKKIEIIDGQQRITTMFLLLRSLYAKLERMPESAEVIGLKTKVAPCIWDVNEMSGLVESKDSFHIDVTSETDEDRSKLGIILASGEPIGNGADLYSKNFDRFCEAFDNYAKDNPLEWMRLCLTILNKCIVLPIECDQEETALTIFSTLNDRGMPLSDADIFKAQIYKKKKNSERKDFASSWRELSEICKDSSLEIEEIFRYYTHVLRARNNDKSKEVGLRKYYQAFEKKDSYSIFSNDILMIEIYSLAAFWQFLLTGKKDEEKLSVNDNDLTLESQKLFHCLTLYPNEFWKYPLSVYFLENRGKLQFWGGLSVFLKRLLSFLFYKFIKYQSVNAIKENVYSACIDIKDGKEIFTAEVSDDGNEAAFRSEISKLRTSKISRALILLHTYLNPSQAQLMPKNFDIEHVFPKKWQTANYNGWDEASAEESLESFGNKIVLETKINIQAGNGYFLKKKERYRSSKSADALELAVLEKADWLKSDIVDRDARFTKNIVNFFKENIAIKFASESPQ